MLSSGDGQVTGRKSGRKRQDDVRPVAELEDGNSKSGPEMKNQNVSALMQINSANVWAE